MRTKFLPLLSAPVILLLCGCNMAQQMKEVLATSENIQQSIFKNCDCEDVRTVSYSIENTTTSALYEVVGSKFESPHIEAERLSKILQKDIKTFCEIDEFVLDFINKGIHQRVTINKCVVQTE